MKFIPLIYLATLLATSVTQADTVLVIGDSIGAGYGLEEHQRWVQLLETKLRKDQPDLDIINASISGDTTSGGLQRLPAALTRFNPDVVIIELGGNDGLRGYPVKQMQKNLESMSTLAQEAGAQVLIAGMLIPSNYGSAYLQRFADAFVNAADNTKASLLPFLLEPIATERDYFQKDGIHPNAEAQPLIAEHVLQSLLTLFTKVPTE
ncbi:MAG: arylesterase [Granulosicoccaceae bacterium]